ncbi:hypothetical protein L342_2510 [Escherichia coli CE516]|uniref:Transactivation protein n=2 Tax=Shigella TaxID=620 RepID=A0A6N3QTS0_SHIFL|nr:hypothetical protein EcF11_5069 [Escherichia coli F11]EHU87520.1 transactivation protein [Escherichia coli DEC4A]EIN84666.1 transactivation protein [Escherichia coli PA22]EIO54711.1 transactivation protein [Escherichia coli TW10246]EIQ03201.1 transactivation protein [Shigella flexneri CCH060]EIQ29039.1 transactivation protein [Shigella boydii 4444-74]EJZ61097.1 transactivation protein [Shigella flexneri 1485-80]EKK73182.1 transactivation protein [Escherichia coli 8.0416]EKV70624.1 hypoth
MHSAGIFIALRHLKRVKAFSLTVKIQEWNTFQANRDTAIH